MINLPFDDIGDVRFGQPAALGQHFVFRRERALESHKALTDRLASKPQADDPRRRLRRSRQARGHRGVNPVEIGIEVRALL